jgi:hypothetical protein
VWCVVWCWCVGDELNRSSDEREKGERGERKREERCQVVWYTLLIYLALVVPNDMPPPASQPS